MNLSEQVYQQAMDLLDTGLHACDRFQEIWARDWSSFIRFSARRLPQQEMRQALNGFFYFQQDNGEILDGYILEHQSIDNYKRYYCDELPGFAAHKNSVETDQESSLICAIHTYVAETGDVDYLRFDIAGQTVYQRLIRSLRFLLRERLAEAYGLLWGAATIDWHDVQPEDEWGLEFNDLTHRAVSIYNNALFCLALDDLQALGQLIDQDVSEWRQLRQTIAGNIRQHLWDADRNKYIPHRYLSEGSPFPADFQENDIFFFGGTGVAMQAGLLSDGELEQTIAMMQGILDQSGAKTVGLTVYPPYPAGFYQSPGIQPFLYANGGDWTWFGGRVILGLIRYGRLDQAEQWLQPLFERIIADNDFNEWYSIQDHQAKGSKNFRGAAGIMAECIEQLAAAKKANAVAN